MAFEVAIRMGHPKVDPTHMLVALNSLGSSDPTLKPPRILRELGIRHVEVYDYLDRFNHPRHELLGEYSLNDDSRKVIHLADQVAQGRSSGTAINLNDMATGVFMAPSKHLDGLLDRLGISRSQVLRRFDVHPRLLDKYLSSTTA